MCVPLQDLRHVCLMTKIYRLLQLISIMCFYCEKYTYHFLTIAICWCHPTHWPTLRNVLRNLKRPVSECELACPPSGHVTTLVNNLHYFCWPSQSVDVFFSIGIFIKFDGFLWLFEFCGKTSVLTMSSQDEIKKAQRESAFVAILWWIERHYL